MSSFRYILVTLLKILVVISLVIILFVVGTMIGYGLKTYFKAVNKSQLTIVHRLFFFLNIYFILCYNNKSKIMKEWDGRCKQP